MARFLDRSAYVAAAAFVAGALIAGLVIFLVLRDSGDGGGVPAATSTPGEATGTPGATETTPGAATVTATPGRYTDPDQALAAFVQSEFNQQYVGSCPGQQPNTICSQELYRSAELVTLLIGGVGSEYFGEVVLTPGEGGVWTLVFLGAPNPDALIATGADAFVYGAGDCLRFRETPGPAGKEQTCQSDGTRGRVVEGPVEIDGVQWWRLEGLGWGSGQYLAPVAR